MEVWETNKRKGNTEIEVGKFKTGKKKIVWKGL